MTNSSHGTKILVPSPLRYTNNLAGTRDRAGRFWPPKYLYDVRGFDVKHLSYYAWIPYAASGLGSFRRMAVERAPEPGAVARFFKEICPGPKRFICAGGDADAACAGGMGVAAVKHRIFLPAVLVRIDHDASREYLSPFGGWIGGRVGWIWRGIGGAIFAIVAGFLLGHGFGYGMLFIVVGTSHLIGFAAILLLGGRVHPLKTPDLLEKVSYG
jgi:MFS transporter, ACS family, hexuronate transporter